MEFLQHLLHIDTYLFQLISTYGPFIYALLFAIIFCETGLVIFPFLPGDSLLFAAGSIAAIPNSGLTIQTLFFVLLLASIFGNKVNYSLGRMIGPQIFKNDSTWFLNKKHFNQAHLFYQTHGGKTIIFARFIPIIRTFVPFVAGVSQMNFNVFVFYNVISAFLWIASLTFTGYYFGTLPFIKNHFTLVIYGIILISLLPPIVSIIYQKWRHLQRSALKIS